MKTFGWVVIAILLLVVYVMVKGMIRANSVPQKSSVQVSSSHNNALALDKVKREPKVKDAHITEVGVLYVSVYDDGTNRNGYASYLCELLSGTGSSVSRVKVVKVGSTNDPDKDNAYGVLLGESWCR